MAEVAKQGGSVETGFSPGVIGSKAVLGGGASTLSFESGSLTFGVLLALAPAATGLTGITPDLVLTEIPAQVRPSSVFRYSVSSTVPLGRVLSEIVRSLDDEPIESGITHPAEVKLRECLTKYGTSGVMGLVRELGSSARAASFLRLLGRSDVLKPAVRGELLEWGLASSNIEVRDAAVQAAESWGDAALAKVLRAHVEPTAWLRDYAAAVAHDLEA